MKRLFGVVAVGLLASALLAGCGKQYDDTSLDVSDIDLSKYVGEVGQYTDLEVETSEKMEVTDDTVEAYINYLLNQMGSQNVVVDRAAEDGDVVNIDYVGYKDGETFDGGSSEGYDLTLGSDTFISGFEDGLIGSKAGDKVSLNLTFPDDYSNEELAGQDVVFDVTVNSVSESQPYELDESVVAMFGIDGVTTVDEFKAYVKENLELSADSTYENELRDNLLKAVYDNSTFVTDEVPAEMLAYYITQCESEAQSYADQYGVSLEEFVPVYYNMEYDEYLEQITEQATTMVQNAMICQKIADEQGIKITDKELKEQMEADAEEYGYDSVDDFKASTDENYYKNYLMELKVTDFMLESAKVTDTKLETSEATTEESTEE